MRYKLYRFPDYLKLIRMEKGMTQKQLAKEMKIPVSNIWHWEEGISLPRLEHLVKLCAALDCTIEDLIERRD